MSTCIHYYKIYKFHIEINLITLKVGMQKLLQVTQYLVQRNEFSWVYEQRQNEDIKHSIRKFSKAKGIISLINVNL